MNKHGTQRLQGTDGIRRETKLSSSSDCKGLTPQQVFIEKGWITEQFMEVYAYSHIKNLSGSKTSTNVVVGWDPRDPSGVFIDAVIKGIRKAGGNALILGIVPTPLVPLFMLYQNTDCGIMITASHNPNDQNGIKLFSPYRGMKPLPSDDSQLTRSILKQKYSVIKSASLKGKRKDCRKKALELFSEFTLAPENSWIDQSVNFKNVMEIGSPFGNFSGLPHPYLHHQWSDGAHTLQFCSTDEYSETTEYEGQTPLGVRERAS